MKKLYMLSIIIIYSCAIKAQGYYLMLDTAVNVWYYTFNIIPVSPQNTPFPGAPCNYGNWGFGPSIKYYSAGDTVMNSLTYQKLMMDDYYSMYNCTYGYLREDTLAKKVYFIDNIFSPEELLYDFSMQIGDSISLNFLFPGGYWQNGFYTLDSILPDQIFAGIRNAYYLNCHTCSFSQPMVWIESAGNPGDLVYTRSANYSSFGWFSGCSQTIPTQFPYDFIQILTCFEHILKVYFDSCAHQQAITNGCLYYADSCNYWNICGTVEELSFIRSFSLFPNPADDMVKISVKSERKISADFIVKEITGKEVFRISEKIIPGINSISLNMHNLPQGIFIIEFRTKEGALYRKMVVN